MNISKDTYLISGDQHGSLATWLTSLVAPLHRARAYLAQRWTRARQLNELHRLTDRELWDVGLSRSDILAIEHGVYRRD